MQRDALGHGAVARVRTWLGRNTGKVPRDPALDSTLALIREGYPFIWSRCQQLHSDIFTARILGKPAVCIHGPEAARIFYDESKLQRHGALPRRVITTLFGKNAVQTLDDDAHRHRKAAFMSLMTPASVERLAGLMAEQWQLAVRRWESQPGVILFDETQRLLTAAACEWVGVAIERDEVFERARQLGDMVDGFGGVGPRLWQAKLARAVTERWMAERVRAVRSGRTMAERNTALDLFSHYRDPRGRRLPARRAAVELLNLIRPITAISWYIAFAAHALHFHPDERARLVVNGELDEDYARFFAQEVRRVYPFTPYLGARVRAPFDWHGHAFKVGTLVLLDVYGANHDPRIWYEPERFSPGRFAARADDRYDFIPQGGGSPDEGHRCAGEAITMLGITLALRFLVHAMRYELVPGQDLAIDLSRMPTRPRSGVVIRNVSATEQISLEPGHAAESVYQQAPLSELEPGVGPRA